MNPVFIQIVVLLFWTASSCDLTLSQISVSEVVVFNVTSSQFHHNQFILCLQVFSFQANQPYLARLDYLPNVGIEAKNDNQMSLSDVGLQARVTIIKKSEPIKSLNHEQTYILAVQVRQAISIDFLGLEGNIYSYIVHQYIFILAGAALISWFCKDFILNKTPNQKIKSQ